MPFSNSLDEALKIIKVKYFSSPNRRKLLAKGETLMTMGGENRRLYLVRKGTLSAYLTTDDGEELELFRTYSDMFAGVYSFFSQTFKSHATLRALQDTELSYIEPEHVRHLSNYELEFLPIMVFELSERQKVASRVALEKEKTLKQLLHTDKMATLGQLAAGLAHELNNAVGVLQRHTEWLSEEMRHYLKESTSAPYFRLFEAGLEKGQFIDSAEARLKKKEWMETFKLEADAARKLAKMGLTEAEVKSLKKEKSVDFDRLHYYWEMGLAFHDMLIASRHAVHVVKSVKQLGVSDHEQHAGIDLNQTINETLALLKSPLRQVTVHTQLETLPLITANSGEFVQVWLNLIKNAAESMVGAHTPSATLTVSSRHSITEGAAVISVEDNGPGVPAELTQKIFQPSFTTKVGGLSFGLGLGLTIVQRLVESYHGSVSLVSRPGKTIFTVKIPLNQ